MCDMDDLLLHTNSEVVVHGLTAAKQYNGCWGTIVGAPEKQGLNECARYPVRIILYSKGKKSRRKTLKVRRQNLAKAMKLLPKKQRDEIRRKMLEVQRQNVAKAWEMVLQKKRRGDIRLPAAHIEETGDIVHESSLENIVETLPSSAAGLGTD